MSYEAYAQIAESNSLRRRIVACAAQEGEGRFAPRWAATHAWELPGTDWVAAWDYALNVHADDPKYDPGADPGVVTDGMILASVAHHRELDAQQQPEPVPEPVTE